MVVRIITTAKIQPTIATPILVLKDCVLLMYILRSNVLLLFKSGINLLTRFGKTNPINFDKNLNSISGSLSNKKAA